VGVVWVSSVHLGAVSPALRLALGTFPALRVVASGTSYTFDDRLALPDPFQQRQKERDMDVIVERCAGLDVGKDEVVACVRPRTRLSHRSTNTSHARSRRGR
jgi:hypothetical protein